MKTTDMKGHLGRETSHQYWDRDLEPALVVDPGSEVTLSLRDGSNGQITRSTEASDLHTLDFSRMDPLTGPIWVSGAQVGDAISVEIFEIELATWGWSGILPAFGLLSDVFPGPYIRGWELEENEVDIGRGIYFGLRPMLGVIGVAQPEAGQHSSVVPTNAGGNIDVKFTQPGSRILLPVFTEGALLSLGDAHALQGDGELSGTAIECEAETMIRIELIKGAALAAPVIETTDRYDSPERYRTFLGVGPDLYQAAREASLRAVDAVSSSMKLEADEAYALLGSIAELRIHEVVDKPNWVVGCMVPLRVLD